jgi:hypothetical protein
VPAQLLGDWFLPPAAEDAIWGFAAPCPKPPTAKNCFIQLTLTATTEHLQIKAGAMQDVGTAQAVVDGAEIYFFDSSFCGQKLPAGVGHYKWTITSGGDLQMTTISEACSPRDQFMATQAWSRAP